MYSPLQVYCASTHCTATKYGKMPASPTPCLYANSRRDACLPNPLPVCKYREMPASPHLLPVCKYREMPASPTPCLYANIGRCLPPSPLACMQISGDACPGAQFKGDLGEILALWSEISPYIGLREKWESP